MEKDVLARYGIQTTEKLRVERAERNNLNTMDNRCRGELPILDRCLSWTTLYFSALLLGSAPVPTYVMSMNVGIYGPLRNPGDNALEFQNLLLFVKSSKNT